MIIPWLSPHQAKLNPATYPISKNITTEIAPRPAIPLDTAIRYLPAVLPAERKSVTLFINPLERFTEKIIPARTISTIIQSIKIIW